MRELSALLGYSFRPGRRDSPNDQVNGAGAGSTPQALSANGSRLVALDIPDPAGVRPESGPLRGSRLTPRTQNALIADVRRISPFRRVRRPDCREISRVVAYTGFTQEGPDEPLPVFSTGRISSGLLRSQGQVIWQRSHHTQHENGRRLMAVAPRSTTSIARRCSISTRQPFANAPPRERSPGAVGPASNVTPWK
jgi:hypothetical protein